MWVISGELDGDADLAVRVHVSVVQLHQVVVAILVLEEGHDGAVCRRGAVNRSEYRMELFI